MQRGFWEANLKRRPNDGPENESKNGPENESVSERGEAAFGVIVGAALILMVVLAALVSRGSTDEGETGEPTNVIAAASTSKPLSDVAELAPTTALISGAARVNGVSAVAAGDAIVDVNDVGQPLVTLSPTALPDDGLPTPQAAARNLWDAWRDNDTQRGLLYARAKVVNQLFQTTWSPRIRQAGCTIIEAGWLCRFEGARDRWDLGITGDSSLGYRVQRMSMGEAVGDLEPPGTLPIASTIFTPPPTRKDGSPIGPYGPPIPPTTVPSSLPTSLTGEPGIGEPGEPGISTTLDPSADPSTGGQGVISSTNAKRKSRPTTTAKRKAKTTKPAVESEPAEQPKPEPEPEPVPEPETKPKSVPADDGPPQPVPVANPE